MISPRRAEDGEKHGICRTATKVTSDGWSIVLGRCPFGPFACQLRMLERSAQTTSVVTSMLLRVALE
jgi:hypothetical protein